MTTEVDEQIEDQLGVVFEDVIFSWEHIDYDPVLDTITDELEIHHAEHFGLERAPSGDIWPDLAASTIAKKGHDRKLWEFGDLFGSLFSETDESIRIRASDGAGAELIYGTSDEKSLYHQRGTDKIPQREHVGMSELFTELVEATTTEFVLDALRDD